MHARLIQILQQKHDPVYILQVAMFKLNVSAVMGVGSTHPHFCCSVQKSVYWQEVSCDKLEGEVESASH